MKRVQDEIWQQRAEDRRRLAEALSQEEGAVAKDPKGKGGGVGRAAVISVTAEVMTTTTEEGSTTLSTEAEEEEDAVDKCHVEVVNEVRRKLEKL